MNGGTILSLRVAGRAVVVRALACAAGFACAFPAAGQCPLFVPPIPVTLGPDQNGIAVGDVNGDGKPDIVTVGNNAFILLGTGQGTFGAPMTLTLASTNPHALALADMNGDGKLDLVVTNSNLASASVYLGMGTGTFMAPMNFSTQPSPQAIAVGDLNGDGKPDVVIVSAQYVSVYLGTGGGTLATGVIYPTVGIPYAVAIGDLNSDGKPDLVVASRTGNSVSVLLGNGTGVFGTATSYPTDGLPSAVVIADVSGDGKPDVLTANYGGNTVSMLRGTGSGGLMAALSYAAGVDPQDLALADFNRDGQIDLVLGNNSVLLGTSEGAFGTRTNSGVAGTRVAIGDFNRDGKIDLAVLTGGGVSILLNTGGPRPPSFFQGPVPQGVSDGATATFGVSASTPTGTGSVTYQWRRNGVNLVNGATATGSVVSGATLPTLSLSNLGPADDGNAFDCVVSNACASAQSNPAGLRVAARCRADVNRSGTVDVFDVFDFVNSWLSACP